VQIRQATSASEYQLLLSVRHQFTLTVHGANRPCCPRQTSASEVEEPLSVVVCPIPIINQHNGSYVPSVVLLAVGTTELGASFVSKASISSRVHEMVHPVLGHGLVTKPV
jgi:hypothetical protein